MPMQVASFNFLLGRALIKKAKNGGSFKFIFVSFILF
jgi:hypothetical protein